MTLQLDELTTDGGWLPFEPDTAAYRQATGWDGAGAPPGLAVALARLAFTRGRPLPPGGVLLGIDVDVTDPLPEQGPWSFRVDATQRRTASGHLVVRIATRVDRFPRDPSVRDARVTFILRWPDA